MSAKRKAKLTRRITVEMIYESRATCEFEVAADFELPDDLADFPDDMMRDLDESIVEASPQEWRIVHEEPIE